MLQFDSTKLTLSAQTFRGTGFKQRVTAASNAGFNEMGMSVENYREACNAGLDDEAMKLFLGENEVRITEVEFLTDWALDDASHITDPKEAAVFHMAHTFNADHVNVGVFTKIPHESLVERFAALCRRARGVKVALEFMPFGGVPDLLSAWAVVKQANEANGGLLIDTWHWVKSNVKPSDLNDVPADKVIEVQLADVARDSSPIEVLRQEALHRRVLPGHGYGDITTIIDALRRHGVDCMLAVEVMSDELVSLGPEVTAEKVMESARDVLEA